MLYVILQVQVEAPVGAVVGLLQQAQAQVQLRAVIRMQQPLGL